MMSVSVHTVVHRFLKQDCAVICAKTFRFFDIVETFTVPILFMILWHSPLSIALEFYAVCMCVDTATSDMHRDWK